MSRIDLQQALLAIIALLSGIFVYLFVRPPASVYFVAGFLQPLNITFAPGFWFAEQLPSFLHTYAFILLTYVVVGIKSQKALYASITLWLFLELLFELGQMPSVAVILVSLTPEWFSSFYVLELIDGFFINGTYDALDVLAILLAALAAWWTVRAGRPREDYQDEH